jgi:hypothetical protein
MDSRFVDSVGTLHVSFLENCILANLTPEVGRLEKVIRRAITEENVSIERTSLPKQFYDLHYSSLDIDHALQIWADEGEGNSQ